MWLCSSSTSIIEDRDLSAHLNILTIRDRRRLVGSSRTVPSAGKLWKSGATRNARPLLRAEERAIVQRMSNENTEVKSFFTRYEAANAIFDVEQIAACYAEVFMFGGPEGVQCVKKEDFLKILPRRKEFFRSRGLVSSNIDSLAASSLDSKYTLVKVVWNMRFDRSASEPIYSQNTASYILSRANDRFQIVFQVDHQDLTKRVQELGLE
jgi:hypothetical protein